MRGIISLIALPFILYFGNIAFEFFCDVVDEVVERRKREWHNTE